jgi:hypothetical protein
MATADNNEAASDFLAARPHDITVNVEAALVDLVGTAPADVASAASHPQCS